MKRAAKITITPVRAADLLAEGSGSRSTCTSSSTPVGACWSTPAGRSCARRRPTSIPELVWLAHEHEPWRPAPSR